MVILTNQFIVHLHKKKTISLQINVCNSYNNLGKFDQLILKKEKKNALDLLGDSCKVHIHIFDKRYTAHKGCIYDLFCFF